MPELGVDESHPLAIAVEGVSKRFRIPLDRSTTLKYRVTHLRSSGRYKDLYALDDVFMHIPFGSFTGIIGPNGCGKSTLLKILAGIYQPTSGTVAVNGHVSPFLELGVGFNPELTARENVYLNGAVLGITRSELDRRIDQIIAFAELEEFADQKLKNFSSGMQVRLAFSVAIQANAGILLMDEVLAVGDARFQERCFDVFNRYKREGRTVVLVTHDLGAVELYCDHAFLLNHGRLAAQGSASDVCAAYRRMVGEQQDAEHAAAAQVDGSGSELPEEAAATRWGTGELRITDVQFLDGDGEVHHTFTTGQPMTVRIHGQVLRQVDDLVCGLTIHRGDGFCLGGDNTFFSGWEMRCPPAGQRFSVDYVIDEMRFLGGHYRLSVALSAHPTHRQIDHVEQAFDFRVMPSSPQWGVFSMAARWRAKGELLRPLSLGAVRRYELEPEDLATATDLADQQQHTA
jgi:ABC-type polysaccharide/polyol phosphate transport system ATPase subunit